MHILNVVSASVGLLFSRRAEPVCDEDFCDSCGDCLVCHAEDRCHGSDDGRHHWVRYVE